MSESLAKWIDNRSSERARTESVRCVWVKGMESERSAKGKSILAHASHGVGYRIIQRLDGGNFIYAFTRVEDGALPYHLSYCSEDEIRRLERMS